MAGKIRISFQSRVFIAILALCWTLVATFIIFQYQRERHFKTELLNMQLQMHNMRLLDGLSTTADTSSIATLTGMPFKGLRITLIDKHGNVVYDNNNDTPFPNSNHNDRPEIAAARKNGTGYIVERWSESDDTDYFYSATLGDNGMVLRSAVPYTHSLNELLEADKTFLWIMLIMTVLASCVGYILSLKISTTISRLNNFAAKAERGEYIFDDKAFPHDELGSIASHIVRLYVQRDQEHREAMTQERDKIRIKKQLTNNINHELKTPVASILVCSELLRDHPELATAKKDEFLQRIHTNANRLNTMLQDISTITRMDDGADMLTEETIDMPQLIKDVISEVQAGTKIEIRYDESAPLTIIGCRVLIESIFRNLIDNAIAYSEGSEISVSSDSVGNFVVKDNGKGVPEEHLPHIFERFYRIDKGRSRNRGGTGLGLSIVRNAVTIHGGEIKATNDKGLRFDFNLKRLRECQDLTHEI